MSAEEILITNHGYTDTAYTSCGDTCCTEAILRAVGISQFMAVGVAQGSVRGQLEPGVTVEVAFLGERDTCEWCACCGDFVQHGLRYPSSNGDIGCQHPEDDYYDSVDPQGGPHPDLRDHPVMREFWSDIS